MVYTEKQSMAKFWWIFLIMAINIVMMFTFWLAEDDPTEKQEILYGLLISLAVEVGIIVLFISMQLKTKIDDKGVTFSFKPFLRDRAYTWAEIDKVWVRKYKPISEYGGWGFKGGFLRKAGRAYNVWGDKGLQLELKNGKRILIGTQKHDELVVFLKRLKEKYDIKEIGEAQLNG
jgi:hypothetical protein